MQLIAYTNYKHLIAKSDLEPGSNKMKKTKNILLLTFMCSSYTKCFHRLYE